MTNLLLFALLWATALDGGGILGPDPRPGPMPGTNATLETPHQSPLQEKACLNHAAARAKAEGRRVTLDEQKQCATGAAEAQVVFR